MKRGSFGEIAVGSGGIAILGGGVRERERERPYLFPSVPPFRPTISPRGGYSHSIRFSLNKFTRMCLPVKEHNNILSAGVMVHELRQVPVVKSWRQNIL